VELFRPRRDERFALVIRDAQPVENISDLWLPSTQAATVGIFLLLLVTALYLGRTLLLPIVTAIVIGATLAPLVVRAAALGIPRWASALLVVGVSGGALATAITLIADPVTDLIGRAPEIGAMIKDKLYVFDRPLAALRELEHLIAPPGANVVQVDQRWADLLAPVLAVLSPAVVQIVLFVSTLLFFLIGERDFRRFFISMMPSREAKLRFLRIANDIEHNLTGYVTVVTVINVVLGAVVGVATWLIGFPNPVLLGILAMVLNYIPYLGPAAMVVVLFVVGLVVFPTLGHALVAPLGFVAFTTVEGHILTPAILGRRLTLNPLTVLLNLAFWTWLWGPMGAFVAAPLSIVGMVTINHLFPDGEPKLPE
jgi:predicted PurR-regulated permease PerM